ncbi:hypothetical protein PV10_08047 [Exophiala mesophila]|uniref:JmjC domain-containing protein n=1 Tax=Exophiala mesophila TaxID=212818 RepID=A0A0D1XJI3_EXOME|nr:uncharacterized protein PV10_08047 [Exophiala mesophila]KIV88356.1 hypothetical protein PV10_08047 [Exophiala mesophila]
MPSARPCAAFEPISPDFDVKDLVESTPNFEWVVRIPCKMIDHKGLEDFEKLVLIHVILGGKPLVIEGYETKLDKWTFALQWLRDNCGSKVETARDLTKKANVPLSIGHYLNNMALLTDQWSDRNYKDPDRQRMYLKDIDCPPLWQEKLKSVLPVGLFYLNDSTGEVNGFGAVDENDPTHPSGFRKGRGIAKAGDLMSSLPVEMRAENLMCYIGHEGTYTPAHREMCASLGQNIMVEASTGLIEDGKPTKAGSSIWFMTESKEREVVSEYWLSRLGHDIEIENHFAQVNAWKNAPFKTYIVEQKPGDFILIPPLAPHQVWNRGTRTMKVAWNRTTVETLEMALNEALPKARIVCRDEQYKNKAMIYYTLQKYSKLLKNADKVKHKLSTSNARPMNNTKVRQLEKDFRRLHALFTDMLVCESFIPDRPEKNVERLTYDSFITCSYCRCNIFNRFLTCPNCVQTVPGGDDDTYDICLDCYAMGRSCACISRLRWVEQWPQDELLQNHEQWRLQIIQFEAKVTEKSPRSLHKELERRGDSLTLAQICQHELARRPFRDIRQPASPVVQHESEEEPDVDENGNVKKKIRKKTKKFIRDHARCHVDCHWEPKWKQASCTTCDKNYCYGLLYRAYDMKPQDVLADPRWRCPSCRNMCGCRNCRNKPGYRPYTPSGTLLGHNTKAIADVRSVESLVDFSHSNIGWIEKAGDDDPANNKRLNKRKKDAAFAKDQETQLGDDYVDMDPTLPDEVDQGILRLAEHEGIPIDPALRGSTDRPTNDSREEDDEYDEHPEGPRRPEATSAFEPVEMQYQVPEGGVIRDAEHAYDFTEAITYDYPDPDVGRHVPSAVEEEYLTSAPVESAPALPTESADDISMINRKRKRAKVDEGDRPFNYKKGTAKKASQQRKSMIVKLKVDGPRLAEIKSMAVIARQALNGVEIPAPVIGSDLQALNVTEGHHQQAPKKVRRNDLAADMQDDDDFTPGRYRDRRKGRTDGEQSAPPNADITRRRTRMNHYHYEEPDEEEFNEVVNKRSTTRTQRPPRNVNVVRLDDADVDTMSLDLDSPGANDADVGQSHSDPAESGSDEFGPSRSLEGTLRPATSVYPSATTKPLGVTSSLAEAQVNRRAKMAAMEWAEGDSDDLDDVWSNLSFMEDSDPAADGRASDGQKGDKQVGNDRTMSADIPPKPKGQSNIRQTTASKTAVDKAPSRPLKTFKVSVAAWGDSDDSSEEDRHPKTSHNWQAVNVRHPVTKTPTVVAKPRGRPRKY